MRVNGFETGLAEADLDAVIGIKDINGIFLPKVETREEVLRWDAAIAALEKTFGALKPRPAAPTPAYAPAFPAPIAQPIVLTHRGDPNTASAMVAWPTGAGRAGVRQSRQLEILSQLFNNLDFCGIITAHLGDLCEVARR